MYLQSIPLSVIGDRAHGEKSINGMNVVEKGPLTKDELNHIVDIASQKGITLTCKEKLKILPVNGGTFWSSSYAGGGIEYPLPTETHRNRVYLKKWENDYSYYFNKALRHHIGRKEVWEKTYGGRKGMFSGLKCDEAGWVDVHHGLPAPPVDLRTREHPT